MLFIGFGRSISQVHSKGESLARLRNLHEKSVIANISFFEQRSVFDSIKRRAFKISFVKICQTRFMILHKQKSIRLNARIELNEKLNKVIHQKIQKILPDHQFCSFSNPYFLYCCNHVFFFIVCQNWTLTELIAPIPGSPTVKSKRTNIFQAS